MTNPLPQEVAELRALIIVDELHMSAVEALDKLCALAAAATPNARLRSAAERAVKGFGTGGSESAFAIDALRAALLASPAPASDHTDAKLAISELRELQATVKRQRVQDKEGWSVPWHVVDLLIASHVAHLEATAPPAAPQRDDDAAVEARATEVESALADLAVAGFGQGAHPETSARYVDARAREFDAKQRLRALLRARPAVAAPAAADARLREAAVMAVEWLRYCERAVRAKVNQENTADAHRDCAARLEKALEAAPPKTAEAEQGEDATQDVLDELAEERRKQTKKWGEQNHDFSVWLAILSEEIGEASHEFLHAHFENTKKADEHASNLHVELVQSAAVLVAMLECGYRNAWWPRSELSRRAQGGAK